ncbi:hypothetical protein SOVF_193110 [Spinacia oleracea]|uniref:F-box protein SNE n=1 Tax=Spinacia oleracea TaxID=3562 RepID=A0A9R0JGM7_SPIOL|nr:F-box protein SNE [Spinacia oleracea]KNA05141.1 hypothetical protein SOVF_193110 [Spinacia oleracea]
MLLQPKSAECAQETTLMFSRYEKKTKVVVEAEFSINDHPDILVEVLKRLDGRSLGVASCVCRLWCQISTSDDSVWEYVCFRHVSSPPPGVRPLVLALGGYKRLYMLCVRPILGRLNNNNKSSGLKRAAGRSGRLKGELTRRVWTRQGAQLLLSLFCVDYYEKLGGGSGSGSGSGGGEGRIGSDAVPSSLMFLCKPVNV